MTVYALKHPDGRWLYRLPTPQDLRSASLTEMLADGQPMTLLRKNDSWWAADHEATRLVAIYQPSAKRTGFRLTKTDALSVRYPAEISIDDWEERTDHGEDLWELYTSILEDQPAVEHVYDGPVVVLEGREPPAPDEPQWQADLPHDLTARDEYRHLFPGKIPGLRSHLYEVIKAMPRVQYCFDGYQGKPGLHITLRVPFDQPKTRWQANLGRNGKELKSGRNVPVYATRHLVLPVPAAVSADTYEQALEEWDRQVEFWLSVVNDAKVAACSACDGTGHAPDGSEKYEKSH